MKRTLLLAFGLALAGAAWAGTLTPIEQLGKNIFFDRLSADPRWMSCATCHDPAFGWTGPVAGVNIHGAVYRGAEPQRFGDRKPPSSAYAPFSPNFHYDEVAGEFFGGNLWDGRATGEVFGNPSADQALGPFNSPAEQNIDLREVCRRIAGSGYAALFEQVWGTGALDCSEAGHLETARKVALSIAAYEASPEVSAFNSKFDAYWSACLAAGNSPEACGLGEGDKAVLDPLRILTDQEFDGLIEHGEYCAPCHASAEPGPGGRPPLFTTHGFDNLGVPKNPENPFYDMDDIRLPNGQPLNPDGDAFIDHGLGKILRSNPQWAHLADQSDGKMRIPTLRNVDLRRGNVPKSYMHNGVFKSLKEVVHFYNTRDVASENWPPPEVSVNVNREILAGKPLGNLELTEEAEDAIVAFLGTLSDGWTPRVTRRTANPGGVVDLGTPRFHLGAIAPNPAHGTFRVQFALPDAAPVTLGIYDAAGRRVASREVGVLGPGTHSVLVGSPGLSSGVYLVRLARGDASLVTRAIVIR